MCGAGVPHREPLLLSQTHWVCSTCVQLSQLTRHNLFLIITNGNVSDKSSCDHQLLSQTLILGCRHKTVSGKSSMFQSSSYWSQQSLLWSCSSNCIWHLVWATTTCAHGRPVHHGELHQHLCQQLVWQDPKHTQAELQDECTVKYNIKNPRSHSCEFQDGPSCTALAGI